MFTTVNSLVPAWLAIGNNVKEKTRIDEIGDNFLLKRRLRYSPEEDSAEGVDDVRISSFARC